MSILCHACQDSDIGVKRAQIVDNLWITQSEPVYRAAIEKAAGFNCTRPLMCQPSHPKQVTLESLGIVERIPGERTWVAWQLTELGRTEEGDIIRGLK